MSLGHWDVWVNHFEYHAQHPREVPSGLSDLLTSIERQRIARSMATFQLAEQSDGRMLLRAAERFADEHRLPSLRRIVELLIREEQRHAAMLRNFLEDHRIALQRTDWTHRVFRRLRRLAGFEFRLHVLLGAELIGTVYYRALESVTRCQRLRVLCRTLVADELAHIGFVSELLLALQGRRGPAPRAVARLACRLLFLGAAIVVWQTHRTVLRDAGYDARGFSRACLAQYAFYLESPVVLDARRI